jgi:hypothetical protein
MMGTEYLDLTVKAFKCLKSMQNLYDLSFLWTSNTGEEKGLLLCWMIP